MPAKYRKHKPPSAKQLKVIALLQANPEMKPSEAAKRAGYAPNTVKNVNANIMKRPIVQSIMDNYRYSLAQHGINPDRLARKMNQLIDAKKPIISMKTGVVLGVVDDNTTQLATVRTLHEVFGIKVNEAKQSEGLKRRVTLEEFEQTLDAQGDHEQA